MLRRFFSQAWLYFKGQQAAFSFEEFISFQTAIPLLTLIFYCVLASYSFNTANLTHWVVGNSFLLCVNTCIFSLGTTFTGERYYGRLRSIIAAPVHKLSVVLQRGFFPMLVSVATVLIGFFAGSLIFGVDFTGINLGLFLLITFIAMFAAAGFGLLLSIFGLVTDGIHFVLNLSTYVLMIFCGANFPIAQLPKAAQFISRIIPLTRSIEAANMLFAGVHMPDLIRLVLGEALLGAAYYLLGFLVIRVVERIAIQRATLDVF
ncbi:MAG: ABC transporter permease [Eubacteriales bacterium]|nr:ABC transporter permease [Eubacteriales bacterium]